MKIRTNKDLKRQLDYEYKKHKDDPIALKVIKIYEKYARSKKAARMPWSIVISEEDAKILEELDEGLMGLEYLSNSDYVLSEKTGTIQGLRFDNNLGDCSEFEVNKSNHGEEHSFGNGLYLFRLDCGILINEEMWETNPYYQNKKAYLIEHTGLYYICHTEEKRSEILIPIGEKVNIIKELKSFDQAKAVTKCVY